MENRETGSNESVPRASKGEAGNDGVQVFVSGEIDEEKKVSLQSSLKEAIVEELRAQDDRMAATFTSSSSDVAALAGLAENLASDVPGDTAEDLPITLHLAGIPLRTEGRRRVAETALELVVAAGASAAGTCVCASTPRGVQVLAPEVIGPAQNLRTHHARIPWLTGWPAGTPYFFYTLNFGPGTPWLSGNIVGYYVLDQYAIQMSPGFTNSPVGPNEAGIQFVNWEAWDKSLSAWNACSNAETTLFGPGVNSLNVPRPSANLLSLNRLGMKIAPAGLAFPCANGHHELVFRRPTNLGAWYDTGHIYITGSNWDWFKGVTHLFVYVS